ncbi:uncharacterized protein LOC119424141 [Nematolebias whitei]|uniref:uncharacterized protein LOC119424141 n=1 Tax=Nematolebias whitei TaxID=451745 RepID=UPI0018988089|nr:uncharacterized protein LOC119424141 [Nematolebias whitei]
MQEDEPLPWKHDHSYALPSSKDELRARLREALARVESLEEDLRSKSTESDLLEDLRVKKLINEEFKEQLDTSYSEDQQLLVIKEEEDLHLWSSSLDQQDVELVKIKEEEEELWTNQEGEQLAVRSEDDDTPEVFQLHRIEVEDNRETQTDNGEVCGGPEPHRNHDPNILQTKNDQRASDSSETETAPEHHSNHIISCTKCISDNTPFRQPGFNIDHTHNSTCFKTKEVSDVPKQ